MKTRLVLVLTGFACFAPSLSLAEVSIDRDTLRLQARLGETWAPMRPESLTSAVLNPYGDARGDGAPSVALAPVSESWEATWALGGAAPGLAFARFDSEAGVWTAVRVPAPRSGSRWAGRTVALHHDSEGNAFLLYDDAETGQVLLASVARDSFRVNPPLVLASPQAPGTSPDALWDGERLVVAFVRAGATDRLEIMNIVPQWDALGRIPDGGEGIPGIPEPIFGHAGLPIGPGSSRPLGSGATNPVLQGTATEVDLGLPPPMLRIESMAGQRLLVTWLHEGRIFWSQRSAGHWSEPRSAELQDLFSFEDVRRRLGLALAGRIDPGAALAWDPDRRVPAGMELRPGRR